MNHSRCRQALCANQIADVLNYTHSGVNVFEGAPDGRQSSDVALPTSRFRPRYRALTGAEKELHDAIKSKAAELEALFEHVPASRYLSLGLTDLESSVSRVIKGLTSRASRQPRST